MTDENEVLALVKRFTRVNGNSYAPPELREILEKSAREALRWRDETRPVQAPPAAVPDWLPQPGETEYVGDAGSATDADFVDTPAAVPSRADIEAELEAAGAVRKRGSLWMVTTSEVAQVMRAMLTAALEDAQRQLAEAQADAERYRWLRDGTCYAGDDAPVVAFGTPSDVMCLVGDELDAAIDAAKGAK